MQILQELSPFCCSFVEIKMIIGGGDGKKESCADATHLRGTTNTGLRNTRYCSRGTSGTGLQNTQCHSHGTHSTISAEHATPITQHIRGTMAPHCGQVPQRSPFYCPHFQLLSKFLEETLHSIDIYAEYLTIYLFISLILFL